MARSRRGAVPVGAAAPGQPPAEPVERLREFVTPEGVDLRLRVADGGQRAAALLVDIGLMGLVLVAMVLLAAAVGIGGAVAGVNARMGLELLGALWLLAFFCLRNGYFIFFELRPRGATPGKRLLGLRVASRDGGRLDANAVFARNAMREIEIYLPLSFLLANSADIDGWLVFFGLVWTGVFVLFPLFNRDRLRVGDFVAGTWVVRAPKRRLLEDLAGRSEGSAVRFDFRQDQLDIYGVKELQVLEDVLRRSNLKTRAAVAERIRRKIGWDPGPDEADWAFLEAFYAALRGRLEAKLLLGKRKLDKFDQT
jgi:uncharacterized RDD family membrane protein YckC